MSKKYIYFCPNPDCIYIRFWFSRKINFCPACHMPLRPLADGLAAEIIESKRQERWRLENRKAKINRENEAKCRRIKRYYCYETRCPLIEMIIVGSKIDSGCPQCQDGFVVFVSPPADVLEKKLRPGFEQRALFPPAEKTESLPQIKDKRESSESIGRSQLPLRFEVDSDSRCQYRYKDGRKDCPLPRVKGESLCIKHKLILFFKKSWAEIWLYELDDAKRKNYGICSCGDPADPDSPFHHCRRCDDKMEESRWWDD